MKNKNFIKGMCMLLVLALSTWTYLRILHSRENRYFPKFDYQYSETGAVLQDSVEGRDDTILWVPEIMVLPLNKEVVINKINMRYIIPSSQTPNVGEEYDVVLLDNSLPRSFIIFCITKGVQLGNMLVRIPFVLEIEYVKYNGKKTFRQAYVFEYLQNNKVCKGIGFVEKISHRKANDYDYIMYLYNTNASKANMNRAKDKRRNYFFSFKEHYTSIDSTFSFR